MTTNNSTCSSQCTTFFWAFFALFLGFVYYLVFRDFAESFTSNYSVLRFFQTTFTDPSNGTFPAFIHTFALSLFCYSLLWRQQKLAITFSALLLASSLVSEFYIGIFDPADLAAACIGSAIPTIWYWHKRSALQSCRVRSHHRFSALTLIAFSGFLITGSYIEETPGCARYEGEVCVEDKEWADPVYMSYSELRRSISSLPAQKPQEMSKFYIYKTYLFINERNKGIHIYSNRFPANPVPVKFIHIPGNTELSIRDNNLYADSYVDLVTFDLSDPENIQLIKREQDIFPFDAFQNIPYNITFHRADIDSRKGVVVSYD